MSSEGTLEASVAFYKAQEDRYRHLRQEAEAKLRQLVQQRAVDELKAEAAP